MHMHMHAQAGLLLWFAAGVSLATRGLENLNVA